MPNATSSSFEPPDLAARPHQFSMERIMHAAADSIYRAWTVEFDSWFATPGLIRMRPVQGEPFYFEVVHEGLRAPHYGRFLALDPDRVVELTWVTGKGGTDGAETVVRVELTPMESGTRLRLTHSGFDSESALARHRDSWPAVLAHLDDQLAASR